MKKIVLLFGTLCCMVMAQAQVTVTSTAGGLLQALQAKSVDVATITDLTISGTINATDFVLMRDKMPKLAVLNLANASIEQYIGTAGTAANTSNYPANGIPNNAFYTDNLSIYNTTLTSVTLPNNITAIGQMAFRNCKALQNINIPEGVTNIQGWTFWNCSALTAITLPAKTTTIGSYAFYGCSALTAINIPATVTTIDRYSFDYCTALKNIFIYGSTPCSLESNFDTFSTPSPMMYIPYGSLAKYKSAAPWSGFSFIEFTPCEAGLLSKAVTNPDTLSRLTIIDTINAVDFAFMRDKMPALKIIDLQFATIKEYVGTAGTAWTTTTNYPANAIPPYAFYNNNVGNTSLIQVIIPASTTKISYNAFMQCSKLNAVSISDKVTTIERGAFIGCYGGVSVDPNNAFYSSSIGALYNQNLTTLYQCPITFTDYEMPSSVTTIDSWAFGYCTNLTNLTLSPNLTTINTYAFSNCSALTSIILPKTLTTIGDYAFENCAKVNAITVNTFKPINLLNSQSAFKNIPNPCYLTVPYGSKTLYENAFQWRDFMITESSGFIVSPKKLKIGGTSNSTVNCTANSNSSYALSLNPNDKYIASTQTSFPASLTITTNIENNTGKIISDTIVFSMPILNQTQKVIIEQDAQITLDSAIASRIISNPTNPLKFIFSNYFKYPLGNLQYTVSSNSPTTVNPIVNGKTFGLIPYRDGQATISVTASSGNGSSITTSFQVTVNIGNKAGCDMYLKDTITPIRCFGDSTGSITVMATTKYPVHYKWSNTRSDSTNKNLAAGTYTVVAIDSSGCAASKTYILTNPNPIVINSQIMQSSIVVGVVGGTGQTSILWSDGTTIPYKMTNSAEIFSITATDSKGCKQTKDFASQALNAPEIYVDTIQTFECKKQLGAIGITVVNGTPPYTYAWSDGATTEDRTNLKPGVYKLTVTDNAQNKACFVATIEATRIATPSIALVTVSDSSHRNLVVWLKERATNIDHYTIYRENSLGEYKALKTWAYTNLSVFVDYSVNPDVQSWRYKLTATDACGFETPKSDAYKTMHLKKTIKNKRINLSWDDYEGSGYYCFAVERQRANKTWELITTLPANVKSYSDSITSTPTPIYHVAVLFDSIRPSLFKTDSGPFSQSFSNMSEASLVEIHDSIISPDITVFPNPAQSSVFVRTQTSGNCKVHIIDLLGQVVAQQTGNGQLEINCQQLTNGMYWMQIESEGTTTTKQFIIKK